MLFFQFTFFTLEKVRGAEYNKTVGVNSIGKVFAWPVARYINGSNDGA